ncbi:MAG: glycosyltransferase [Pseudomonadota bacterium]
MTRLITFRLEQHGLADIRFVLRRDTLPCNGDLESAALDGITDVARHAGSTPLGHLLKHLAASARAVVVIRNPNLVLDAGLSDAVLATLDALSAVGDWALAGPGGLGVNDRRHIALYASQSPALPEQSGFQPLIDLMPDLYVVNAEYLRLLEDDFLNGLDQAFEPALAVRGYLDGRVSVFAPMLCSGINGDLMTRDHGKVIAELHAALSDRLHGQTIETLSGPVRLGDSADCAGNADSTTSLQGAMIAEIAARSDKPSVSLITRTRFDRLHLLRRMLTSVSRARDPDMTLEVILSTDADPKRSEDAFAELQQEFVNLKLRLKLNPPGGHSRVTNLMGGIQTAHGEYLLFLDDDDYLDIFAFDTIRPATFAGNRPVIALTSHVHEETWEATPSNRWVLAHSVHMTSYPSAGWRNMFAGVNRMPICGMMFSRQRLRARLKDVPLNHDLSEDYALFLLMLTDPAMPSIHECPEAAVHISIRENENSVLMTDRRPWVRDITRFLADLTAPGAATGAGQWMLHADASMREAVRTDGETVLELQHLVERREQEIRMLRRELEQLRRIPAAISETAA